MAKLKIKDQAGKSTDLELGVMDMYGLARDERVSARVALRIMAQKQGVAWNPEKGDLLDQAFVASGLVQAPLDGGKLMFNDLSKMSMDASFRRNDGTDQSIAARVLFPQLILETMTTNLLENDDPNGLLGIWSRIAASTTNLNGNVAFQPTITTNKPEQPSSGRIAQLAEPETMVSITTGERSVRIPTQSIGLLITDQAQAATSIDLVRIVMAAQARQDRLNRVAQNLKALVLGDADMGISALPVVKATTLGAAGDGTITKKAFVKWIWQTQTQASLTQVFTDLDSAFALDDALAQNSNGSPNPSKIQPAFSINLALPSPTVTPVDATLFGAKMMVGIDPRYAIQRFVDVSATYTAVENYVMRRATGFRVDYGELSTRLYDEAWSVLNLGA